MSLPAYPHEIETGVELLGRVPDHWVVKPIKAVASHNDCVLSENTPPDFEMRYVEISDVGFISGIASGSIVTFDAAPSRARRLVRANDILVSTVRTYLRAIAPISCSDENLVVSTGFCVVRALKCNERFLSYALRSEPFVAEVISRSTGVSYPAINASDLMRIKIAIPPVEEQKSISAFLDRETGKVDALVAEQQRLIELLTEKRRAIVSHAVTAGLNPDVALRSSEDERLCHSPAHWDIKPLKYLVRLRSGGTPSKARDDFWDGDVPWASAKDLRAERLLDTIDHITDNAVAEGGAELNPAGSILILVRGMTLAKSFPVVVTLAPVAINQDLKAINPKNGMTSQYLAWALRGTARESMARCAEAGHGTKVLRMDDWLSMPFPRPPEDEQLAIATYLDHITSKIDELIHKQTAQSDSFKSVARH